MKLDRRTLATLFAILACALLVSTFRNYLLFCSQALTGGISMKGISVMSTTDNESPVNVGGWSLHGSPTQANSSRDQILGLALVKLSTRRIKHGYRSDQVPSELELYCRRYPSDLKARAHLLRLGLNVKSLEGIQNPTTKEAETEQLAEIAASCSLLEPKNWYWRERQLHYLSLAGHTEKAVNAFIAQPFPDMYEDYVADEVKCKESLYVANFQGLPQSALLPIWYQTEYPHYSTFRQRNDLTKMVKNATEVRLAQIEFGLAQAHSCTTAISAIIGVNDIRHGLWNSTAGLDKVPKDLKTAQEAIVKLDYLKIHSISQWDHCLRVANSKLEQLNFEETDIKPFFMGQYGPIFVATGLMGAFMSLLWLLWLKSKFVLNLNPYYIWIGLVAGVFLLSQYWNTWNQFTYLSFGSRFLHIPLILLGCLAVKSTLHIESHRVKLVATLIAALVLIAGFISSPFQGAALFVLLLFVLQRGKTELSPWVSACGLVLLAYHCAIALPYSDNLIQLNIGFALVSCMTLLLTSRALTPDAPRLAPLSISLAFIILGTVLFAQYDNSVATYLQSDLEKTLKIKKLLANL